MPHNPSTIVLNGFWAKTLQVILVAAILAGGSGLLVSMRQSWAQDEQAHVIGDHEARLRGIEQRLGTIDSGVRLLLERTDPNRNHQ